MHELDPHLSDEELVLAADGELSPSRTDAIREHLLACWICRARQSELAAAVAEVVRWRRATPLPAPAVPRAELQKLLAAHRTAPAPAPHLPAWWRAAAAAAVLLALVGVWNATHRRYPLYEPSPRLTPGVARTVNREQLCNSPLPKNQVVPAEMRQRVFQVYGLVNADPRAYEVDYLITPALGGADDIRNLWPEPYRSTAWNARVKDALEDRLRDLVCHGGLDLAEAQRDISRDWIAAYKKYFGTAAPPADGNPPEMSK